MEDNDPWGDEDEDMELVALSQIAENEQDQSSSNSNLNMSPLNEGGPEAAAFWLRVMEAQDLEEEKIYKAELEEVKVKDTLEALQIKNEELQETIYALTGETTYLRRELVQIEGTSLKEQKEAAAKLQEENKNLAATIKSVQTELHRAKKELQLFKVEDGKRRIVSSSTHLPQEVPTAPRPQAPILQKPSSKRELTDEVATTSTPKRRKNANSPAPTTVLIPSKVKQRISKWTLRFVAKEDVLEGFLHIGQIMFEYRRTRIMKLCEEGPEKAALIINDELFVPIFRVGTRTREREDNYSTILVIFNVINQIEDIQYAFEYNCIHPVLNYEFPEPEDPYELKRGLCDPIETGGWLNIFDRLLVMYDSLKLVLAKVINDYAVHLIYEVEQVNRIMTLLSTSEHLWYALPFEKDKRVPEAKRPVNENSKDEWKGRKLLRWTRLVTRTHYLVITAGIYQREYRLQCLRIIVAIVKAGYFHHTKANYDRLFGIILSTCQIPGMHVESTEPESVSIAITYVIDIIIGLVPNQTVLEFLCRFDPAMLWYNARCDKAEICLPSVFREQFCGLLRKRNPDLLLFHKYLNLLNLLNDPNYNVCVCNSPVQYECQKLRCDCPKQDCKIKDGTEHLSFKADEKEDEYCECDCHAYDYCQHKVLRDEEEYGPMSAASKIRTSGKRGLKMMKETTDHFPATQVQNSNKIRLSPKPSTSKDFKYFEPAGKFGNSTQNQKRLKQARERIKKSAPIPIFWNGGWAKRSKTEAEETIQQVGMTQNRADVEVRPVLEDFVPKRVVNLIYPKCPPGYIGPKDSLYPSQTVRHNSPAQPKPNKTAGEPTKPIKWMWDEKVEDKTTIYNEIKDENDPRYGLSWMDKIHADFKVKKKDKCSCRLDAVQEMLKTKLVVWDRWENTQMEPYVPEEHRPRRISLPRKKPVGSTSSSSSEDDPSDLICSTPRKKRTRRKKKKKVVAKDPFLLSEKYQKLKASLEGMKKKMADPYERQSLVDANVRRFNLPGIVKPMSSSSPEPQLNQVLSQRNNSSEASEEFFFSGASEPEECKPFFLTSNPNARAESVSLRVEQMVCEDILKSSGINFVDKVVMSADEDVDYAIIGTLGDDMFSDLQDLYDGYGSSINLDDVQSETIWEMGYDEDEDFSSDSDSDEDSDGNRDEQDGPGEGSDASEIDVEQRKKVKKDSIFVETVDQDDSEQPEISDESYRRINKFIDLDADDFVLEDDEIDSEISNPEKEEVAREGFEFLLEQLVDRPGRPRPQTDPYETWVERYPYLDGSFSSSMFPDIQCLQKLPNKLKSDPELGPSPSNL